MNSEETLESFYNLVKHTIRYKDIQRIYSDEIVQCSVMTIFKFQINFLRQNPKFSENLKSILSSNFRFSNPPVDDLLELIRSRITSRIKFKGDILEIFYTQRVSNTGDLHSGEVCFPGGKLDQGETDLQAALREVEEEVGLEITNRNSIYLGKLPINYYAYVKKGKRYFVSQNFALCLSNLDFLFTEEKSPLNQINMKLSINEIKEAWWVPYDYFIRPESMKKLIKIKSKLPNYTVLSFGTNPSFEPKLPPALASKLKTAKFQFTLYIMKLDKTKSLWGMSLVLTGCMVELGTYPRMRPRLAKAISNFSNKSRIYQAKSGLENLDSIADYGMACRLETLRMARYMHGSLTNLKL